jgi:integrase
MQSDRNGPLRERVERGIYKRRTRGGETRYEVAYLDSDGRQRWRTVGTLREARQLRADLVSRVGRGERVAPSKATLAEFADGWLARQESRLRPRTHERYASYLRLQVKPRLGARRLQSITVDDVADLIAGMEAGVRYEERDGRLVEVEGAPYAAWTIRSTVMVLGRVLGSAERSGIITSNPVRRLERGERPKVKRPEFPSLDRESIGRLVAATPEKYRVLVAVSVLTGLRQGEALGLQWQDVDVKDGVLRVRHQLERTGQLGEPKTQAAKREVPFPPSLGRMLSAHREEAFARGLARPTDFVFASETGGPLHHRNIVRRGLEKAVETADLPELSWHALRHVAASVLIAEGASVAYVSRVLGHASPAITLDSYAHEFARAEHADRTRERMERAFGTIFGLS